jgi:hypothetical protein
VLLAYNNLSAHRAALLEHHPEILAPDAMLSLTINPPVSTMTAGGISWCFASETNWSALGFGRHPGAPGGEAPWLRLLVDIGDLQYFRVRLAVENSLRAVLRWFPASVLHLSEILREQAQTIVQEVHDGTMLGRPHRLAKCGTLAGT